jgi:non-heme chloroperoxidase
MLHSIASHPVLGIQVTPERCDLARSPERQRLAHLPSGINLPYLERGSRHAPPVLLLHGISDSCRSFEPMMPCFPEPLRAIAPTLRGHSGATQPGSYRLDEFAADIAAFMNELALENALVVGHSMGASVALRFALDFPDKVVGLVLMGGFAALRRNSDLVAFGESSVLSLTDPVSPAFAEEFQRSTLARPIPQEMLHVFVRESLTVPAGVWRGAWSALAEADFTPDLARITAPTLLIRGERDNIAPADEQEAILASLLGSRLVTLADAGHAPHWENPAQIAALVGEFAREVIG